jgi:parallel beta-helix repeat protein
MFFLVVATGCRNKFPEDPEDSSVPLDSTMPIAYAGRDATYLFGETVTLDGSQSRDPKNRPLKYKWAGDKLNPVVMALPDSAKVRFTPTMPGRYVFILTVTVMEDTFKIAADQVQIDVARADWYVSKSKPLAPTVVRTIEQALNKAAAGDTIFVEAGEYRENLRINKPIFMYSTNATETIINGGSKASTLFLENVQNAEIRGFTITGGGGNDALQIDVGGVTCHEASNIVIRNNHIKKDNVDGIRLVNSRDILIINNEIAESIFNGIRTTSSSFDVAGNQIHDNNSPGIDTVFAGITLEGEALGLMVRIYDNTFRNNRSNHIKLSNNAEVFIENNKFFEAGGGIVALQHVGTRLTLTANEFRGIEAAPVFCKDGTHLEMQNNIFDNAGEPGQRKGVDLINCTGNLINNQIRGYPIGFILFSSPMMIRQNIFENNEIAIKVSGDDDCPTVQNNTLNGNQTNYDYSQTTCPQP